VLTTVVSAAVGRDSTGAVEGGRDGAATGVGGASTIVVAVGGADGLVVSAARGVVRLAPGNTIGVTTMTSAMSASASRVRLSMHET